MSANQKIALFTGIIVWFFLGQTLPYAYINDGWSEVFIAILCICAIWALLFAFFRLRYTRKSKKRHWDQSLYDFMEAFAHNQKDVTNQINEKIPKEQSHLSDFDTIREDSIEVLIKLGERPHNAKQWVDYLMFSTTNPPTTVENAVKQAMKLKTKGKL